MCASHQPTRPLGQNFISIRAHGLLENLVILAQVPDTDDGARFGLSLIGSRKFNLGRNQESIKRGFSLPVWLNSKAGKVIYGKIRCMGNENIYFPEQVRC